MPSLPKVQFHSLHMNKSNVIASNIQTIIKKSWDVAIWLKYQSLTLKIGVNKSLRHIALGCNIRTTVSCDFVIVR